MSDTPRDLRDTLGRLARRMRALMQWRRFDADLAEEMAAHEAMRREEFERDGLSARDAAHAARRAMGDSTVMRESARGVWRLGWMRDALQDLVYGARALRRSPSFALVAVLGLGGGLGFAAAAFNGYSAFTARGWDVHEPDRLVALYALPRGRETSRGLSGMSIDQINMLAAEARTLDGVFGHLRTRPDGTGAIVAAPVTAGYFGVLGLPMQKGRGFLPEEDRIGAPQQVLVVSHAYWTTTLAARADVIGSTVRVAGVPFSVVGVTPPGFHGTDLLRVEAWYPMAAVPVVKRNIGIDAATTRSSACCVAVAARLAPGVSKEEAAAEVSTLLERMRRPGIDTVPRAAVVNAFTMIGSAGAKVQDEFTPVFAIIAGGVGAVLLLACANVANLLLARASARRREIGIRLALGASRGRIVRQLMTESFMLALLASVPATAIAYWTPHWVLTLLTPDAHTMQFAVDARLLLFTAGLVLATCMLFGLAPALHASRPLSIERTRLPLRSVFLSAQVCFCTVLLVGTALFWRSAQQAHEIDLGFATRGVTELRVSIPATADAATRSAELSRELPVDAAGAGVHRVAYTSGALFNPNGAQVRAPDDAPGNTESVGRVRPVTREYFSLLDIRLMRGRPFTADTALHEVVINQALAQRLGARHGVVGGTLLVGTTPRTIVGIVDAVHDVGFRDVRPAFYEPYTWDAAPRIIVRDDPAGARRLAAAIMARDPSLTVSIRTFDWYVDEALTTSTFAASLSGVMGTLALVLATIGMFGVLSYWVQQRQQDISVRMALGAAPRDIVSLVLGATGRAVGWGLLLGVVVAVGGARLIQGMLFGLSPLDPLAYAGAGAVIGAAAILAITVPVWRAVRIEPIRALRAD